MVIAYMLPTRKERKLSSWFISEKFRLIKRSNQGVLVICKYFWDIVVNIF